LKKEINNQTVVVYRGGHGTCTSIPIRHLVVGDIVDIQQGNRIPADCILIEEMNITVDESMYDTSTTTQNYVAKEISHVTMDSYNPDNHKDNPDPFLYSDTKVMSGQGKALVCAVG
jgi:Ca2+-transporting ATPase